jgi:hypothetical protein
MLRNIHYKEIQRVCSLLNRVVADRQAFLLMDQEASIGAYDVALNRLGSWSD